ncbi:MULTISPECIES: phosphoribosyl-ATP diphosphatase [unclassified Clostridium]|uniref:phosphoribosyl-ATP diphosphatase n=1 Tax=unclassified Clostridium TaxID=2614128 RepID=UPI00052CCF1B|nr:MULTISPECIES: phosphoribosyl-ATP diphosphatase [unclassified Clostridium]KGK88602.1 phosphoribosyl-ATP pyrophosphatase [Clostridium sp. HMP27]
MNKENVIKELYKVIESRKENSIENSYTSYLFEKGLDKVLKKVGEECSEVIIGSKNNNKNEMINEISDLVYHLLVLMAIQGVKVEDVEEELIKRTEKIGNKKPERSGENT